MAQFTITYYCLCVFVVSLFAVIRVLVPVMVVDVVVNIVAIRLLSDSSNTLLCTHTVDYIIVLILLHNRLLQILLLLVPVRYNVRYVLPCLFRRGRLLFFNFLQ